MTANSYSTLKIRVIWWAT